MVLAAGPVHYVYFDRSGLPDLDAFLRFEPPRIGKIFDERGTVLIELAREYRHVVTFDEVPPIVREAILAAEDKDFFSHSGVEYGAFPRVAQKATAHSMAAWWRGDGLRPSFPQGGSTLTQQLVRTYFLRDLTIRENSDALIGEGRSTRVLSAGLGVRPTNKLLRKMEEVRVTLWLEKEMERRFGSQERAKQEIFARYASFIYMGNGRYGFAAASEYYFDKALSSYTEDDAGLAALLAGISKSPRVYAPVPGDPRPLRRRNAILELMARNGSMALVQQASRDAGDTTSSSLAFAASNTAGNFIAVALRAGRSHQVFTVSDSRGNLYRQAARIDVTLDTPLGGTLAVFYAENTQAGANVVTVSQSTSATLRFAILEYAGVALASSLQGTAAAQGIGATPTSGSTTTAGGNLVFGAIMTADARIFTVGNGFTIRTHVPAAPLTKLIAKDRIQPADGPTSATATLDAGNPWGAVVAAFRPATVGPQPDLTLTKTPAGGFVRGQSGATYTLTVSNIGSASTAGSVTLADTLPSGLTATDLSGSNWTCTLSGLSCTRGDALAAAESYPPVTLTVSVAANAPASVTNAASVTGGGDPSAGNNSTSVVTPIATGPDVQPPTTPGGLTATASGQDRINLNWTASTDDVGVTDYRVEQCQGAGCTDFTEIAQVEAASAVAGPLTVSANPHYFRDTSGAALILNGSHTWNNLQDWGLNGSPQPFDFDAYVDFLLAHGHNFTLLWYIELPKFCYLPTTEGSPPQFTVSPHPWQRTGPGTATDGALKFDLSKFDQAYFDRLRSRVEALNEAGIYVGVYTFTGEFVYAFRCWNDGYPFTGANNINGIDDGGGANSFTMTSPNAITAIQDAYVERVIDTVNDLPNVLWIVSQEASPGSLWWNDHQISHIRSYESGKPFQHPIGYGIPRSTSDTVLFNSDADWIAGGSKIAPTTSCGSGTPTCKVNVNDSDHPYFGMWNESAQANRNYAWQNFTNGNQVLFMDPYVVYYPREGRNLCSSPTNGICPSPDPRWQNFRDNLGDILTYSRKLNLTSVTPSGSLSSTSHCLAQTPSVGAEYLVYAPSGGSFTVNLSAMGSTRTLNVEWFNPSTGATTFASPVPAGSTSRSFTPPFSGDAVLYLVDTEGHAGTVPVPTSYGVSGLTAGTHRYRVRGADGAGNLSSYSNIASATVQAPDCNYPTLTIRADRTTLDWTPTVCLPSSWGVATGLLSALRSSGGFGGASCLESGSLDATAVHATTPGPGSGSYYLVRVSGGTWNDGHQAFDRNATLAACP